MTNEVTDDNDGFEFFDLNPNRLDTEWLDQARRYHEHALKYADARRDYEQAKTELALAESEARLKVRRNPAVYGLDDTRPTVDSIKDCAMIQPEVREAARSLADAGHEVDVHKAAVDALSHRKAALENLVKLRLSDYYSEPSKPAAARDDLRRMERDKLFTKKQRGGAMV